MSALIDLTGQRFGRRTVLAMHPERLRYGRRTVHVLWLCRCEGCGTEGLVTSSGLRSGHTTQCNECRLKQAGEQLRKRNTTHGMSKTRAYWCWANMLQRCFNPNHPRYDNYGGRGILPSEDYRRDFKNFFADNGHPPPGLSIDRINNDRGYVRENLHWATPAEQVRNRRPPKKLRIKLGDPKILAGLKQYTARLARAGERT